MSVAVCLYAKCGKEIPPPTGKRGRPKFYCCDSHRVLAHRARSYNDRRSLDPYARRVTR